MNALQFPFIFYSKLVILYLNVKNIKFLILTENKYQQAAFVKLFRMQDCFEYECFEI